MALSCTSIVLITPSGLITKVPRSARLDVKTVSADIDCSSFSKTRKRLIGAFFCHEYTYAAAALMNPSIVPHPDQSGISGGAVRFVMSLRAVGERE